MENNDENNTPKGGFDREVDLFAQLKVPYSKTKEAAWEEIAGQMKKQNSSTPKVVALWKKIAVAAAILIVSGLSFIRFYTNDITCPQGKHLAHTLPDGSTVQLNAGSTLSYAPYWWLFDRNVKLEGEAFFEVKKGKSFVVSSDLGTTTVLGTSFNIYAREKEYKVYCKTGKVAVCVEGNNVLLMPEEQAILKGGGLEKIKIVASNKIVGWMNNSFYFDGRPLVEVLNELERQYDISVDYNNELIKEQYYTGLFSKSTEVEQSLNLICLSFNIKFLKKGNNKYQLVAN